MTKNSGHSVGYNEKLIIVDYEKLMTKHSSGLALYYKDAAWTQFRGLNLKFSLSLCTCQRAKRRGRVGELDQLGRHGRIRGHRDHGPLLPLVAVQLEPLHPL